MDKKFEDIRNFFEPKACQNSAKMSSFLNQNSECIAQASYLSTTVPETSPELKTLHNSETDQGGIKEHGPSFNKITRANATGANGQKNSLNI